MAENSGIQWTDHTFNPWWGCTKVSPGCANCYAETLAVTRRKLPVWGPAPRFGRKLMSDGHWKGPEKWNRVAAAAGERHRVFCASMADVFDEHPDVDEPRARLFDLIERTPHLDWQLLTKRPHRVLELVPRDWHDGFPSNVWLGTSVEDQRRADERIRILRDLPAAVRFLSCEPLLGPVDLRHYLSPGQTIHVCASVEGMIRNRAFDGLQHDDGTPMGRGEAEEELWKLARAGVRVIPASTCDNFDSQRGCLGHPSPGIDWVIVGGESGPGARPCNVEWIRSVVQQCRAADTAVFVKQLGAVVLDRNDRFDAHETDDPRGWPEGVGPDERSKPRWQGDIERIALHDRKGGDPEEWPEDLRVREFPTPLRRCRECGCTDLACRSCIEATGHPCSWVEGDLCSRCEARA